MLRRNTLKIGEVVDMTPLGESLAAVRGLLRSLGEVRDVFNPGRRNEQVYARREMGGSEWWPTKAWKRRE